MANGNGNGNGNGKARGMIQPAIGVLVIGYIVGAIWWAATITERLRLLSVNVSQIQVQVLDRTKDRWTSTDHMRYAEEIERRLSKLENEMWDHSKGAK